MASFLFEGGITEEVTHEPDGHRRNGGPDNRPQKQQATAEQLRKLKEKGVGGDSSPDNEHENNKQRRNQRRNRNNFHKGKKNGQPNKPQRQSDHKYRKGKFSRENTRLNEKQSDLEAKYLDFIKENLDTPKLQQLFEDSVTGLKIEVDRSEDSQDVFSVILKPGTNERAEDKILHVLQSIIDKKLIDNYETDKIKIKTVVPEDPGNSTNSQQGNQSSEANEKSSNSEKTQTKLEEAHARQAENIKELQDKVQKAERTIATKDEELGRLKDEEARLLREVTELADKLKDSEKENDELSDKLSASETGKSIAENANLNLSEALIAVTNKLPREGERDLIDFVKALVSRHEEGLEKEKED